MPHFTRKYCRVFWILPVWSVRSFVVCRWLIRAWTRRTVIDIDNEGTWLLMVLAWRYDRYLDRVLNSKGCCRFPMMLLDDSRRHRWALGIRGWTRCLQSMVSNSGLAQRHRVASRPRLGRVLVMLCQTESKSCLDQAGSRANSWLSLLHGIRA